MEKWLYLLSLLACPLMMLLCMRGMSKNHDCKNKAKDASVSTQEMDSLKKKVAELTEQNQQLMKEMKNLK